MQAFLWLTLATKLFSCIHTKSGVLISGVSTADRSKLNENPHLSQCHPLFCEENSGKIDPNDIYCLKALITLEQINPSMKTSKANL